MSIRCGDGAIQRRFDTAESVPIQQRPQKRERRRIACRHLEVELRKAAGIRASRIEDANEWSRDTEAPSQVLRDAVANRGTPDRRGIVTPGSSQKRSDRTALRLEQGVNPLRWDHRPGREP